jgi:hypothetical protein
MRDGECWALATRAPIINAPDSGWWPTPQKMDATGMLRDRSIERWIELYKSNVTAGKVQLHLSVALRAGCGESKIWRRIKLHGIPSHNPNACQSAEWTEWLMGFPIGLTELKPLETPKFLAWLHSHGTLLLDRYDAPGV